MPYIIERDDGTSCTRGTLAEAQHEACRAVHESYSRAYPIRAGGLGGEHSDAMRAHRWHALDALRIPEAGGELVGLPDGSRVRVSWAYVNPQGVTFTARGADTVAILKTAAAL